MWKSIDKYKAKRTLDKVTNSRQPARRLPAPVHENPTQPRKRSYRIPLFTGGGSFLVLVIFLYIKVLLLPCSEGFWSRLFRAIHVAVTARGTTELGIIGTLLYPVVVAFKDGLRLYREKGRAGVKQLLNEQWTTTCAFAAFIWTLLVVYNFVFMPPRTLTTAEVAEFSQRIVIDIEPGNPSSGFDVIGSGFWGDGKGYMVTVSSSTRTDQIKVGMLIPPIPNGRLITVALGILYTPGEIIYHDASTGIDIVRVYNNPFIRKLKQFAEAENTKTHQKEKTFERSEVPCFSEKDVSVGDALFVAGIEPTPEGYPSFATVEGRVTRVGVDTRVRNHGLRIYTTLPFKRSYIGAPVLDDYGRVVGIVFDPGKDSTSTSVVIPAKYIVSALQEAKPLMSDIHPTPPFN